MINIPYGISDLETIISKGYFYQDRTDFISKLEKWGSPYLIFLRPRRFGKSLFVNTLQSYYGIDYKEKFNDIFGNLAIGKNPTPLANSFLVLSFEFSRIDTKTEESTYRGFLKNALSGANSFISRYPEYFTEKDEQEVLSQISPESVLKTVFDIIKRAKIPHKIYILIDEYDHFANELLSFDLERFKETVSRNGFVRKFYESLKTATNERVVGKIFITGVSPVTMDSLTSGFNISDNISTNPLFHDMMGFTGEEMVEILKKMDIPSEKLPSLMEDLKDWYDGYHFHPKAPNFLYNPDMVLYFLKEYGIAQEYPDEMLDVNIVSDYRKIQNLFQIGGEETERYELLEELVKIGYADFPLTRLYNLEGYFTAEDFLSLLFYMGMLRVKEARSSDWRFEIPNYVIKKLYFEYFAALFLDKTRFARTHRPITKSIDAMMNDGNPEDFFKIVEYVLQENHSNRDEMVYGEKHLQTLMIGLLFPYKAFMIHSEYETKKQYPDIFLEKIPDRNINYEVVLELKYVKKSQADTLEKVISGVRTQLDGYMRSERFTRKNIKGFYVVFLGGEIYEWKEISYQ